ncbi:MAG: sulfite exporter TauE/SafE family protein [Bacteroidetes bacterium]|nr:sulfite exporter TauE/SafE family protein [Bacteroidota bacterium]
MSSEILSWALYIVVGTVSGFLNTVAGGGTLISLPILIFMGLPGSVANATLRVAILAQNIFAVGGFHSKGQQLPTPYVFWLAAASLIGGWIGASLAIDVPDHLFNRILAIIMVVVVLSILFEKKPSGKLTEELLSPKRQAIGVLGFLALGVYGGFIQAGIGFLVIALLTHLHHFPLVRTNYIKVFAAVIYTGSAVVAFALAGKIIWSIGFIVAIGHAIGAWFGSRWSVKAGDVWIKRVLLLAVSILVVKLWFFS